MRTTGTDSDVPLCLSAAAWHSETHAARTCSRPAVSVHVVHEDNAKFYKGNLLILFHAQTMAVWMMGGGDGSTCCLDVN